jgi:hypothetical protein
MKRTLAKLVVGVAVVASVVVVPMSGAFARPGASPPPRGDHVVSAGADEVSAAIAALFGSAPGAEPPPFVCPPVCVDVPGDEIALPDLGPDLSLDPGDLSGLGRLLDGVPGLELAEDNPVAFATCEVGWNSTLGYSGVRPPYPPEGVMVVTGWISDPSSRGIDMNDWVSNLDTHIVRLDINGLTFVPADFPDAVASQRTADLVGLTKPVYYVVRIAGSSSGQDVVRAFARCGP